ncbi:MAG: hypothetical protein LQ349_006162 [Xanthoria aureola]|nr:MAG: hypothetical protein LQ349_006162 [Xanthoria aureola]
MAPPRVPPHYTVIKMTLKCTVEGANVQDEDSWQLLSTAKGSTQAYNVGPVIFEYGLSVSQKAAKGVSCTVTWGPKSLRSAPIVEPPQKPGAPIRIELEVGTGSLEIKGDPSQANQLPLAEHYAAMKYVRLEGNHSSFEPAKGYVQAGAAVIVGHLKAHLTGNVYQDVESAWNRIVAKDRRGLAAEAEAERKSLGGLESVSIETMRGRTANILLVKVFRAEAARDEGTHYDPETTFGQSYIVNAPKTFPSTKESLKAHPVPGGETLGWQMDLAKESNNDDSDAIFVGSIQNYISASDMDAFVGKQESTVSLEPIFNNVQNTRAVRSQTKLNEDLVLASRAAHGFDVLPEKLDRVKSKLPMEMLFADMECDPAKNTLLENDVELTPDIIAQLNESQQSSVRMAVKSKVSVIVGPPGTGKSRTLAGLIAYLVLAKEERVAACAVQNQAVNELLAACLLMWRSLRSKDPPPFVRFFSEGMIAKQYEAGDHAALGMECHIQSLRLELANKKQIQYGSFLQGVRDLEAHGRILSLDSQEAYSKQAKTLTDEVLKSRKVLFVTLATSSAPTLFKEDENGEAVKYYQASTIVCDEAGTVLRPFVLIACPVIKSSDAQAIWSEMYLSSLYAHLIYCIYKGFMIHSVRKTKDVINGGSPLLTELQREPIRATTSDGDSYLLNSFLHFVDVDGRQEKKHNGSSKNVKEALAIDAMVRALIARGVEREKIGVMTGYKAQRLELKRLAKENGWDDIKIICTVDASQGGQMEFVFFSLVTTEPYLPHFMGQKSRANVGTSRQQEALYIVGKQSFWWKRPMVAGHQFSRIYMHRILSFMAHRAQQAGRSFLVHREGGAPR